MARALAAVVACLAVVACAPEPSSAPSPMSLESVEASPSEVETFVDPMPDPPELTLQPEGDDFEPVIREIFAFRGWLFGHPDRDDMIAEIMHDSCPCNDLLRGELIELRVEGDRILGHDAFSELRLVDVSPNSRSFVIRRISSDLVRINELGRTVDRLEHASGGRSLVQLTPGPDGRWRIQSIRSIEEAT